MKYVTICFHCVQEACASGMIQFAKEEGDTKMADLNS